MQITYSAIELPVVTREQVDPSAIRGSVLWLNLDSVDERVVLDRREIYFQHAVSSGLHVAECLYRPAVLLIFQDVEALQQGCAIAKNVEDAASYSSRTAIAAAEPSF